MCYYSSPLVLPWLCPCFWTFHLEAAGWVAAPSYRIKITTVVIKMLSFTKSGKEGQNRTDCAVNMLILFNVEWIYLFKISQITKKRMCTHQVEGKQDKWTIMFSIDKQWIKIQTIYFYIKLNFNFEALILLCTLWNRPWNFVEETNLLAFLFFRLSL